MAKNRRRGRDPRDRFIGRLDEPQQEDLRNQLGKRRSNGQEDNQHVKKAKVSCDSSNNVILKYHQRVMGYLGYDESECKYPNVLKIGEEIRKRDQNIKALKQSNLDYQRENEEKTREINALQKELKKLNNCQRENEEKNREIEKKDEEINTLKIKEQDESKMLLDSFKPMMRALDIDDSEMKYPDILKIATAVIEKKSGLNTMKEATSTTPETNGDTTDKSMQTEATVTSNSTVFTEAMRVKNEMIDSYLLEKMHLEEQKTNLQNQIKTIRNLLELDDSKDLINEIENLKKCREVFKKLKDMVLTEISEIC